MGNVVGAGLGQNPARQAAIKAGLPVSVGATTINKVCGSGLKAVMLAAQVDSARRTRSVVVAGGMENMSLAPVPVAAGPAGIPHGQRRARRFDDPRRIVGRVRRQAHGHLRRPVRRQVRIYASKQQDDFAVRSYTRARKAIAEGVFDDEIVPVEIKGKKGSTIVSEDEEPARFNEDKLRALRPAFGGNGTVTAGNASSINDGAAALLVVSDARCASLRLKPLARIVGAATFSREPEWFTIAPIGAIEAPAGQESIGRSRAWICSRSTRHFRPSRWRPRKRSRTAGGESEYLRRGSRAGSSDRRERRANSGDAAQRLEANRRQTRRRLPVHWRRRGRGTGCGNDC